MKVSQLLKVSAVVLALGVVPMHSAFAHEDCADHGSAEQGSEQKAEQPDNNQAEAE